MSETAGKIGRPALPKKEKRWLYISVRISQDENREIDAAAKAAGIRRSKWIRTKVLAAARRT